MPGEIIYLLVVLTLYSLYRFALMLKGDHAYKEAKLFEEKGEYREACYKYAEALSGTHRKECKKRIKYLWDTCGTFGYLDIYDECSRLALGGNSRALMEHFMIMSSMAEVVLGKK